MKSLGEDIIQPVFVLCSKKKKWNVMHAKSLLQNKPILIWFQVKLKRKIE